MFIHQKKKKIKVFAEDSFQKHLAHFVQPVLF